MGTDPMSLLSSVFSNTIARRLALCLVVFTMTPAFGSGERIFAPSAEAWERWEKSIATSTAVIDHDAWSDFLSLYLVENETGANRLDYDAVTDADRKKLDDYLSSLSAIQITTHNRAEQKAYWMNLYNALTVRVILDHYPVESIRDIDISPGVFSDGPWDKELIEIEGEPLSLNDIEHRILRPLWQDPLIHYGVNCASVGCPDLQPTAFKGSMVSHQLVQAARAYINDGRGVTVEGGKITVSKIYDWFIEDFGRTPAAVKRHLLRYADPGLAAGLTRAGELDEVAYDWRLNDAAE